MFYGMRYIYTIYQEKSFSKAAAKLYISQPSLSAAVKKAEQQLGFPIFDRSTVPLRLTELGQAYIRSIEVIMDVETEFRNFVNDVNEIKEGSFSIGGTNLFVSYVLPPLLSRFMEKYPNIRVNLIESTSAELTEMLNRGELDLLMDNLYLDDQIFEKTHICSEHLLLSVPKKYAINSQLTACALTAQDIQAGLHLADSVPLVPLEAFKDIPFLMQKPGNDTRVRAEQLCSGSHFNPKIRLELDQQITAYNLSCAGLGICFSGDVLIKHVPINADLVYYKLSNQEALRSVSLYAKRNRYLPRAAREFLAMASQEEL